MSNIRRGQRDRNFTTIENIAIEDANLSPQSLGVLVYVLSKHPSWKAHKSEILNRFSKPHSLKEGRKIKTSKNMIDSVFSELIDAGYIEIEPILTKLENGKMAIAGSEYVFYDTPKKVASETPISSGLGKVPTSEHLRGSEKLGSIIKTESNIDKSILEDNKTNSDFLQKSNTSNFAPNDLPIELVEPISLSVRQPIAMESQKPTKKAKELSRKQQKQLEGIEAAKAYPMPEGIDKDLFDATIDFCVSRYEKGIPFSSVKCLVDKTAKNAPACNKAALLEHLQDGKNETWKSPYFTDWFDVVQKIEARQKAMAAAQIKGNQTTNEPPFSSPELEAKYQNTIKKIEAKVPDIYETKIAMLSRSEFRDLFIDGETQRSMAKFADVKKLWSLAVEVLNEIALGKFGIKQNVCSLHTHIANHFKNFKAAKLKATA